MADHAIGAALYALKAVKHADKSVDKERKWHIKKIKQLPSDIAELVLSTMMEKGRWFKV